jgi:hypothetical protein
MRSFWDINHLDGFTKLHQPSVPMPIRQQCAPGIRFESCMMLEDSVSGLTLQAGGHRFDPGHIHQLLR